MFFKMRPHEVFGAHHTVKHVGTSGCTHIIIVECLKGYTVPLLKGDVQIVFRLDLRGQRRLLLLECRKEDSDQSFAANKRVRRKQV